MKKAMPGHISKISFAARLDERRLGEDAQANPRRRASRHVEQVSAEDKAEKTRGQPQQKVFLRCALILLISLLCSVPTASLGNNAQTKKVAESGYWPAATSDCEAYSRTSSCHYLLCVCYAGCNTEAQAIDLRKKNLCDGQFKRCLTDPNSSEF